MNTKLFSFLLLTGFLMLGCQSKPKLPVPQNNPPVAAVQDKPDAYINKPVTWGGVILSTEAKESGTEIILLAKRLESSTRPIETDILWVDSLPLLTALSIPPCWQRAGN